VLTAAHAADDECVACCRASGLSGCRTSLKMYGDGSVATAEGGAWRVLGLWVLGCDGQGRFEAGSTAVVASMPISGELFLASTPPAAFHCFTQACSFPRNACFDSMGDGRIRLVDCRDGAPMPASELAQPGPEPPGSESIIAVVGGRPLVVLPALDPAPTAPVPTEACCGAPASHGLFGRGASPQAAVITSSEPGTEPPPASVHPPTLGDGLAAAEAGLVIEIPQPPLSADCGTAETLRAESRRLVDAGNEAELAGQDQRAIDAYRAALTLDACNPFAWADLGATAVRLQRPAEAALALAQAVELQPRHYTAFTNLGLAYEALGHPELARAAYMSALGLRPHHAPAQRGLERLDRSP
jgi:hypothetical protein